MNKWIPISLLVFLGIYLLTTVQAPVTESPVKRVAGTLSYDSDSNNLIPFPQR